MDPESLGPVRVAVLRRPNAPEPTSSLFSQAGVQILDLPLPTGDQEALSVMGQALASSCAALVLDLEEDEVAEQLTADSKLPVVLASQAVLIRNVAQALVAAAQLEEPFAELHVAHAESAAAVADILVLLGLPEENLTTFTPGEALPEGTHLFVVPREDLGTHEGLDADVVQVGLDRGDDGLVLPALTRAAADSEQSQQREARRLGLRTTQREQRSALDPERCGEVARALASLAVDGELPTAGDPRLIPTLAAAAADVKDRSYREALDELTSPLRRALRQAVETAKAKIRRIVFVEGDAPGVIEAARRLADEGLAVPFLLGDLFRLESLAREQGLSLKGIKVFNPKRDKWRAPYAKALHESLGRELGIDLDHTTRLVEDPRVFAALTVAQGEAHAIVALGERGEVDPLGPALRLLERRAGVRTLSGATIVATKGRTLVVAEATDPTSEEIATAALQASALARTLLGTEPRVALLAHTSYGAGRDRELERIARARELVAVKAPDLKIDGPLEIETALDTDLQKAFYEFCSLEGEANVLVVPGRTATRVTLGALAQLAGAELLGPIKWGLQQPAGLAPHGSSANHLVLLAAVTAAHAVDAESEVSGSKSLSALRAALEAAVAEAAKTPQPQPRPKSRKMARREEAKAETETETSAPAEAPAEPEAPTEPEAAVKTGPDAETVHDEDDGSDAETVFDGDEEQEQADNRTKAVDTSRFEKPRIDLLGSGSEARSRTAEELMKNPPKKGGLISFGPPSEEDDSE